MSEITIKSDQQKSAEAEVAAMKAESLPDRQRLDRQDNGAGQHGYREQQPVFLDLSLNYLSERK